MIEMYKILGVSKNATTEEIKKKYKKLALLYHPDKNPDSVSFSRIHEAYSVLMDPQKRREYDMKQSYGMDMEVFVKMVRIAMEYKKLSDHIRNNAAIYGPKSDIYITWTVKLRDVYRGKKIRIPYKKEHVTLDNEIVKEKQSVLIDLVGYQKEYTYTELGHSYKKAVITSKDGRLKLHESTHASSLIVHMNITDDATFDITDVISPYDLKTHVVIDFVDYIVGKKIDLRVFDTLINLIYEGGEPFILTESERGLPAYRDKHGGVKRGDLYVILDFRLPDGEEIRDMKEKIGQDIWNTIKCSLSKNAARERR